METQRTAREHTAQRWRVAAAVAAVALLIAGTVVLAATGDADRRAAAPVEPAGPGPSPTTTMEPPPPTLPGDDSTQGRLLPAGSPSTPHASELVATVAQIHNGGFHLYADGRLVGILDDRGSGWLEQRLTPEGVERVRSEILASGMFDPARRPREVSSCELFQKCVRDGTRLLAVDVVPFQPSSSPWPADPEAVRLLDYYRNLGSSLPPNEWVDQDFKPYVPSRIGVCLRMFVDKVEMPADMSLLLPRFPARAAALLDAREVIDAAKPGARCVEMTLEEARELADELLSRSGHGTHAYWGIVLRYDPQFATAWPGAKAFVAYVNFQELQPDGAPLLWGG